MGDAINFFTIARLAVITSLKRHGDSWVLITFCIIRRRLIASVIILFNFLILSSDEFPFHVEEVTSAAISHGWLHGVPIVPFKGHNLIESHDIWGRIQWCMVDVVLGCKVLRVKRGNVKLQDHPNVNLRKEREKTCNRIRLKPLFHRTPRLANLQRNFYDQHDVSQREKKVQSRRKEKHFFCVEDETSWVLRKTFSDAFLLALMSAWTSFHGIYDLISSSNGNLAPLRKSR